MEDWRDGLEPESGEALEVDAFEVFLTILWLMFGDVL